MLPDVSVMPYMFKAMAWLLVLLYTFVIVVIMSCLIIAGVYYGLLWLVCKIYEVVSNVRKSRKVSGEVCK